MINYHPGNSDHRHMFLVVGEEHSRCSRFNPPLLFISKRHDLKEHGISY